MKFLDKFGFQNEEINDFMDCTADVMINAISTNKRLVQSNLSYLVDLGVKNVKEVFTHFYEIFLMDHSNFMDIFNKYDKEDLIEKLAKNVAIVEYL